MTINAIAVHVKDVLSVDSPMIKNTIPRMRNIWDVFRLFNFIEINSFVWKLWFWLYLSIWTGLFKHIR